MDGQPIAVLSNTKKKYDLYLVNISEDETTYSLTPVVNETQLQKLEDHTNDTNNPHKVTYEQVGLRPHTETEIIEIINSVYQ